LKIRHISSRDEIRDKIISLLDVGSMMEK
jgi:hypothetical protein